MAFQGFTEQTIDFLYDIFMQNERLWFEAHKDIYLNSLQRPMKELADEVYEKLTERYPDRNLICRVTRIYRDARRCHSFNFYKDSLWFNIQPPAERGEDYPSFWFELSRDNWNCGLGIWNPSAATMARHRARIERDPDPLSELRGRLLERGEFSLTGKYYARFKTGAPDDLGGWYNMKSFAIVHNSSNVAETFDGPALAERLVESFSFLMPYYDYFYPLTQTGQHD